MKAYTKTPPRFRGPKTEVPRPVDIHVGEHIRLRRVLLGISQEQLSVALGITSHQVQKYEQGIDRVGASQLFNLSETLDVPISFFFDALPQTVISNQCTAKPEGEQAFLAENNERETANWFLSERKDIEFMQAYRRINDPTARKKLLELMISIADNMMIQNHLSGVTDIAQDLDTM